MRRSRAATLLIVCIGLMVGVAASVQAAEKINETGKKTPQKNDEPSLLTADDLTSDESLSLVIARGHVELVQGERKVEADVITYNQKTRIVIATGSVKMYEASGEVMFSDYAELTDDLREAFVNNARVIMSDASRTAGTEAERTGGRYTRMNHVTYSPCYLCTDRPGEPAVWQLQATKSVHDNVDKDVRYTDAFIDVLDVPVLYMPYFSHPDPTVKRRSGFLTPYYGNDSNLGFLLKNSYYFDIDRDLDATLEGTYYTKEGPMLGGQIRKRFDLGTFTLNGDIIHADKLETTQLAPGQQSPQIWRGYANGTALFDINDAWRWGGDLNVASDQTFLREYYNFVDSMLTSRVFAEGFYGRDYVTVRGYHFQDMRTDNTQVAPNVAPMGEYSMLGDPGSLWGGRWSMDTSVTGLTRTSGGASYTRMSLEPGWMRRLESDSGLVTTVTARARADMWNFNGWQEPASWNLPPPSSNDNTVVGPSHDGTASRAFPQGQVKVSYPLVRNGETTQQIVEPIAAVTVAPRLSQKPLYPNEDSQDVELDATSLFDLNRFVGQDRQEGGQRVTYGVRTGMVGLNEGSGSIFIGQDYRLSRDNSIFGPTTGLETQKSDYVAQFDLSPASWFFLDYRTNYDAQTLQVRRQTVTTSVGVPALTVSSSFHFDHQLADPVTYQLQNSEYTTLGVSSQLSRYWSGAFSQSMAVQPVEKPVTTSLVLTYSDECFILQSFATVNWQTASGVPPGQTVYFRLVFKGLGEVRSPSLSLSGLEGSSSTTSH